jgi:signal transduction histidine kinase
MTVDILDQDILGSLNERQRELVGSAREDTVRLTKLSRELLQLSKLESGRLQLKNEPLEIPALIESCLRPLQLQFREKGVTLVADIAPGLPLLVADEQQISSVISNLVSNALKYTPAGGRVQVRVRGMEGAIQMDVEDTGIGIAAENLPMVFDKFMQVKQRSETTPGSVGLGLAIAKEVVEMYGGRIWAESTPGQGSTFSFRLPVGPAAASTAPAATGAQR